MASEYQDILGPKPQPGTAALAAVCSQDFGCCVAYPSPPKIRQKCRWHLMALYIIIPYYTPVSSIQLQFRGIGCIMIMLQSCWIPPVSRSSSPNAQSRQWKLTRQAESHIHENMHNTAALSMRLFEHLEVGVIAMAH